MHAMAATIVPTDLPTSMMPFLDTILEPCRGQSRQSMNAGILSYLISYDPALVIYLTHLNSYFSQRPLDI